MKCKRCGVNYDDKENICPVCGKKKPPIHKYIKTMTQEEMYKVAEDIKSSFENGDNENKKEQEHIKTIYQNKTKNEKGISKKAIFAICAATSIVLGTMPQLMKYTKQAVSEQIDGFKHGEDIELEYKLRIENNGYEFYLYDSSMYFVQNESYNEYGYSEKQEYHKKVPQVERAFKYYDISEDKYNISVLKLKPESYEKSGNDELGKYILIAESKENPENIMLYDINHNIYWLDDNVFSASTKHNKL